MKIKVGVREYALKYQDEIVEVGGEMYGKLCSKELEITLASKFPAVQQDETFLHEIIHAVAKMQDLRDIDGNEHWVDLLASGLHMVIVDNPHIFTMSRPTITNI